MNRRTHFTMVLAVVLLAVAAGGQTKGDSDVNLLQRLRPQHPRLIVLDADVERTRALLSTDRVAQSYLREIRREAEKMLNEPTVVYKLEGPRLLSQSRRCLHRVLALATMYRLDGDHQWLERAVRELEAAAAFPDWNPSHFLDTAEMTHAFAIGYDWLYHGLGDDQRAMIREAIVEKGLKPGIAAYEGARYGWWRNAHHNWNQVCNGGLMLGALAIAEDEPELAEQIMRHALASLPRAMRSFAPDGGWNEGPGYWEYTIRYTVPLIATLQSALGNEFGLADFEGFDQTGSFRLHFVGPTRLPFNFADAGEGRSGGSPMMYWLGRRFDQPQWYNAGGGGPLGLFWYQPVTVSLDDAEPLDRYYRGIDVVFMRSGWDSQASFVGFKGGDNKANHSHLDLGTFVFDAIGERWVMELGPDDYNLPAYFGRNRWTYYRLQTQGQNTLLLDEKDQDPAAKAPIVAFAAGDQPRTVADLTAGYAPAGATCVWRGIALVDGRRSLLVQDEVQTAEPVTYRWQVHTRAEIELDGAQATLRRNGKTLTARILSPEGARFAIGDASAPPPQNPNKGVHRLEVHLPGKTSDVRVTVLLTPQGAAGEAPAVVPLQEWVEKARGR